MSDIDIVQKTSCFQSADIPCLLKAQAERNPDAIAITAPGRTPLTYHRLHTHITKVVATLNAFGLRRNDRVAIVLPQGPEMAVAFLAVAAGATSDRSIRLIAATNLIFISQIYTPRR